MLIIALITAPALVALLALAVPSNRLRTAAPLLAAAAHVGLTWQALQSRPETALGGWLALDALGAVCLLVISALCAACGLFAVGYLNYRIDRPNRVFCTGLCILQSTMTLVVCSRHLGLMWVGMEATTLASAPLIYFNRTARSLEATWKYLLVCSVGIALALLGSFLLAYASLKGGAHSTLLFDDLLRDADSLSTPWLRAAYVFLLVGYGTKMGLAPMYAWKPDAYGEAPGIVGALLAGGMTTCAFLLIARVTLLCGAAGQAAFAQRLLLVLGVASMAVAAIFLVRQRDFKRMLAYSSVEHMGILTLGLAVGGAAIFGVLLHIINNALTKALLFLAAGNIHRAYGSKSTELVRGAMQRLPLSATCLLVGLFAITGSPPFGPFVSMFHILAGVASSGMWWLLAVMLALLFIAFVGMASTVLATVQGQPSPAAASTSYQDSLLTSLPLLALVVAVFALGVWMPEPLRELLERAALQLGGTP